MKRILTSIFLPCIVIFLMFSCKKKISPAPESNEVPEEVLAKIKKLGYSTNYVAKYDSGYIVEGDIFLGPKDLDKVSAGKDIRIANTEQYRTTNLIGVPLIFIKVHASVSQYATATDIALDRYDALGLNFNFDRVTWSFSTPPTLTITIIQNNNLPPGTLAASGFPSSGGLPYHTIELNENLIGINANDDYVATIIAHELGHCIGFRHTDYMDVSYSCQFAPPGSNEGDGGIGAIHIPGTPAGPEAGSWMLACIDDGVNRPFTANDVLALQTLYQ